MAISTSRVSVASIKETVKTSVTTGSVKNPLDFQSIADKATSAVNSAKSKLTNAASSVQNKIDSALSGVESNPTSLLGKGKKINLSFNTSSLGFFENILCGKLPSLNLRLNLPKIKLDFSTDLKFGIDVTICGKSKSVNPVDAAMSVVNAIRDPQGFLSDVQETAIEKLLQSNAAKFIDKLGFGSVTDCIIDSVKANLNSAYGEDGITLKEKLNMYDATGTTDCTGDILQDLKNSTVFQSKIAGAIFGKLASLGDHTVLGGVISKLIVTDEDIVLNGIGDMFKWTTYNANPDKDNYLSTQLKAIHGTFGSKTSTYKIISLQEGYVAQGLNSTTYTQSQAIYMQTKSEYILSGLANEKTSADNTNDTTAFESLVGSLNILDKSWTLDSEGNINLYRTQDNSNVNDMASGYLTSRNKDFTFDGNVTTSLDMGDLIAINNGFDSETYEKVLVS